MIRIGITLALGFIIGDSIRNLRLAILASVAAGILLSLAFIAAPFVLNGAATQVQYLLKPMLLEGLYSVPVALVGLYFGRRRSMKGYGA